MKKDAYYFPHFSNARHDRKLRRIIKDLGVEGYGIFFMTLEVLREQTNFKYPVEDIDLLADEFRVSDAKLRAIICNYDLFTVDLENFFYSENQIEFLQPYIKSKEQRRIAGIKSGEKRRENALLNDRSTTVQRPLNKVKESKVKESKVKESKVKDKLFEEFWNFYGKKIDRKKTESKFLKLSMSDINKIRENLNNYIKSTPDIKYRKNPVTYLNNRSWENEISEQSIIDNLDPDEKSKYLIEKNNRELDEFFKERKNSDGN